MYLYTIKHIKTGMTLIGISKHDPRLHDDFKVQRLPDNDIWRKHVKKHRRFDRKGNPLTVIKVLHESTDLKVLLKWKRYYYKCWNVLTNPLFIHSLNTNKRPSGKNHANFGKRYVTGSERHWFNDGYNTNVFVPTGTQPSNYRPGRIVHKNNPNLRKTDQAKRLTKLNGAGHKCVSPDGIVYDSLTDAGKAEGVTHNAIKLRIKRGRSGWKYV
jgi:hypothetical protein